MKKHPLTPTQRGIRDCLRNGWKLWDVGSSIYLGDPERDIFQYVRRQTLRALLSKGIVTWYEKCNGRNYYILAEEASEEIRHGTAAYTVAKNDHSHAGNA